MWSWLLLISDILSIITIALCIILKVPQIYRLIKSGEAAGLSLKGLLLELSSYTVSMMYNYTNEHALLSYLEYPFIVLQEYILIGFVMHYKNYRPLLFALLVIFYVSISLVFAFNILSKDILTFFVPLTTLISAVSKIMQLMEITSSKNANSVSILTWFLSVVTNASRIYTVYLDSADVYILLNFIISSTLSGTVMGAAMYYQRLDAQKKRE